MSAESLQHAWEWLLSLSKVQLILLGGGVSLLVAVSKILRFLFLLGLLVTFLTVLLPGISRRYEQSPISSIVNLMFQWGVSATQDPQPEASAPTPLQPQKQEGK